MYKNKKKGNGKIPFTITSWTSTFENTNNPWIYIKIDKIDMIFYKIDFPVYIIV